MANKLYTKNIERRYTQNIEYFNILSYKTSFSFYSKGFVYEREKLQYWSNRKSHELTRQVKCDSLNKLHLLKISLIFISGKQVANKTDILQNQE